MKKISLLLLFFVCRTCIQAQKNEIALSTGCAIPVSGYYPKVKYEYRLHKNVALGVTARAYLDSATAKGLTGEWFVRCYIPSEKNPAVEHYFQFSTFTGITRYHFLYSTVLPAQNLIDDGDMYELLDEYGWVWLPFDILFGGFGSQGEKVYAVNEQKVNIFGAGATFGQKRYLGKGRNFFLDMNIGFKLCPLKEQVPEEITVDGLVLKLADKDDYKDASKDLTPFEKSRPGKMLNGFLGFGYRF